MLSTLTERRRQELFLDGMEVSADMAVIAYSRLRSALEHYSRNETGVARLDQSFVVVALLDAWSIVDSVNRLRTLVPNTPLLKKRSPGVVSMLKGTEGINALRHFVQHMDERTLKLAESGYPVWGSLSWVYASKEDFKNGQFACMVLIPGRLAKSKGHPIINPIGREVSLPVGMISLTAGGVLSI